MSDIEFHIENSVVPSTRPAAHIVSIAPVCHPGGATLNHRLENRHGTDRLPLTSTSSLYGMAMKAIRK